MSWFNWFKQKQRRSFGKQGATEKNVPLQAYAPNLSLTPQEYLVPLTLAEFEADFDRRVAAFLEKSNPDANNGSYFDGLILGVRQEALDSLALQRADHVGAITALIEKIWSGDRIKCAAKLATHQVELDEVNRELARLTRIYHAGTALEEDEEATYEKAE